MAAVNITKIIFRRQFRIVNIPTLMAFRDGKVMKWPAGAKPKSQILEMLQ